MVCPSPIGERVIFVRLIPERLGNEEMPRHGAHRLEDARIADTARGNLLLHHRRARRRNSTSKCKPRMPI